MPFKYDFNNCLNDVKTIDVEPEGWKGPITIEYGVAQKTPYDTQLSVVWRIKGTTHTFAMYERNLNVISHGTYHGSQMTSTKMSCGNTNINSSMEILSMNEIKILNVNFIKIRNLK